MAPRYREGQTVRYKPLGGMSLISQVNKRAT